MVAEFYVAGKVTNDLLRRCSITVVEEILNLPHIAERVRAHIDQPGPDLRTAASYFATGWFGTDSNGRAPHWGAEMLHSQYSGSPVPVAPAVESNYQPPATIDCHLAVPMSKPWPDEFYRSVWNLKQQIRARGGRDWNLRIAAANNVSLTTAAGWTKRAKERFDGTAESPSSW